MSRFLVNNFLLTSLLVIFPVVILAESGFKVQILESNDKNILCQVTFDSVSVIQLFHDGTWYQEVTIAGCAFTLEEGLPKLPVTSVVLGIPNGGEPEIEVLSEQSVTRALGRIVPVEKQLLGDSSDTIESSSKSWQGWYPAAVVRKGLIGKIRHQRILQIELYPVRHMDGSGLTQITRSVTFRVAFKAESGLLKSLSADLHKSFSDPYFDPFYQSALANYETSKVWRSELNEAVPAMAASLFASVAERLKLEVKETGLYVVTGKDLLKSGVDLNTIDPRLLKVMSSGKNIPIIVEGFSDGVFDQDDRFIFWGEHNRGDDSFYSFYSNTNVYWISWNDGAAARYATVTGALPAVIADTLQAGPFAHHFEYDRQYDRLLSLDDESADHWFWQRLADGDEFKYPLGLRGLQTTTPIRIRVMLQGLTRLPASPDHRVLFYLNEQKIGEAIWDNQTIHLFDSGFIQLDNPKAQNELLITVPGDLPNVPFDHVYLNWIKIDAQQEYRAVQDSIILSLHGKSHSVIRVAGFQNDRIYILSSSGHRITDYKVTRENDGFTVWFANPTQVPVTYFLCSEKELKNAQVRKINASDLRNSANGADYIIITHPDFKSAAQKLANFRSSQGFRTFIADVMDIYTEFSDGRFDPRALKNFLRYTFETWRKPAPAYVVLLGDATYRMDKVTDQTDKFRTFVPTMLSYTYSWGMSASDNYFVAVSGSDDLPDMHVGRLPANTTEEANIMVQKIMDHETQFVLDDWRRNILLLSGEGSFFEAQNELLYRDYVPKRMVTNWVSTGLDSRYFGSTNNMVDYINTGQTIVNFVGHGGGGVYLDAELFLLSDVSLLKNKNKYPMVFSLTCFTGGFDNPDETSIGEALLREPHRGIIAHFGSTGRAYLYGDLFLNKSLFDAIFWRHMKRIGDITTFAKYDMVQKSNGYWDHVRNYSLIGDPASSLQFSDDQMELTVAKSVLTDGESMQISGKLKFPKPGSFIVSAFNERDSLITTKKLDSSDGTFTITLFTLDAATRNAWGKNGGYGVIRCYFSNPNTDAASAISFAVNRVLFDRVSLTPENASHNQDIYFEAALSSSAMVSLGGLNSVEIHWSLNGTDWKSAAMQPQAPGVFRAVTPIRHPEATTIYFKAVAHSKNGTLSSSPIFQYRVRYRPDLTIPLASVRVTGNNKTVVDFQVKNTTESPSGAFNVFVQRLLPNTQLVPVAPEIRIPSLRARSDSTVSVIWETVEPGNHTLLFHVDSGNQVEEADESNNLTEARLQVATIARGTGGALSSATGRVNVTIAANALSKNVAFKVTEVFESVYPEAALKAGLIFLKSQSPATKNIFRIEFSDSVTIRNNGVTIQMACNITDSLTHALLQRGKVHIYGWSAATQSWLGLPSEARLAEGVVFAHLPAAVHIFGLFGHTDQVAPGVRVTVEGQNFVSGDVVSQLPAFIILLEDSSGLDVTPRSLKIEVDDIPIPESGYTVVMDAKDTRHASVTFKPELDRTTHVMKVQVNDVHGNSASQEVTFSVAGAFGLLTLANHPNPFQDHTIIAFTLADMAQQVNMDIYTVSGQCIRSFKMLDVAGYQEQFWDGLDEEGNEIANGVYYLKIVAQSGSKKIEKIQKIAKLL